MNTVLIEVNLSLDKNSLKTASMHHHVKVPLTIERVEYQARDYTIGKGSFGEFFST